MRISVLLVMLCVAGCARDIGGTSASPTGNTADLSHDVLLNVPDAWKGQVMESSLKYATAQLAYPKTVKFEAPPTYAAFYDKNRLTSRLLVTGRAYSTSPNGRVIHETFVANWHQDGNAATNKNTEWEYDQVDVRNDDSPRRVESQ